VAGILTISCHRDTQGLNGSLDSCPTGEADDGRSTFLCCLKQYIPLLLGSFLTDIPIPALFRFFGFIFGLDDPA